MRDIYREAAARLFGVPTEEVTDEQMRWGKLASFGDLYGMTRERFLFSLSKFSQHKSEATDTDLAEKMINTFNVFPMYNSMSQEPYPVEEGEKSDGNQDHQRPGT